ncbi:hypothetical protein JKA73_03045 [Myxococcus xanthus]|uniref:hypothetical protein n=1 Tax=Myxococcus xanthus TaxID=34 RepID=UPI0019170EDF|nr:hypothetical protein [Myxococcus xanthus]QQR45133.1 hypothetical protein JKA73_03045 [Myxococcus xanthus]
MPHFNGRVSDCKIHTTKVGTCGKGATCDYRTNTVSLPIGWDPWEAHHVLCFQSVNAYGDLSSYGSVLGEIDDCYKLTDWCLNQPPNMFALPRKGVYRDVAAARGLNRPCHDVDHNLAKGGYRDEVTKAFISDIWDPIKDAVDNATSGQQHFTPADVLSAFQDLEKAFLAKLVARGTRSGGTLAGWANRGSTTNFWWLPFSMADDAVAMANPRLEL